MNIYRVKDLVYNFILPILIGVLTYWNGINCYLYPAVRNHLADGLWAYALMSVILIIWDRNINKVWVFMTFLMALVFEYLQFEHLVTGTGDVLDLISYLISFVIAIKLNSNFKYLFHYQNLNYENN